MWGVPRLELVRWSEGYIPQAAELLARAYGKRQSLCKHLSPSFREAAYYQAQLRTLSVPLCVAMMEGGVLRGMLGGWAVEGLYASGRGVYVPSWACLLPETDRGRALDGLYRAAAVQWASQQRGMHAVTLPMDDGEAQAHWFDCGFGRVSMDVVCSVEARCPETESIECEEEASENLRALWEELILREAVSEDADALALLAAQRALEQLGAPTFLRPHSLMGAAQFAKWLANDNNRAWLAELNGSVVGYLMASSEEINTPLMDDGAALCVLDVCVLPVLRKKRIASRLLAEAFAWARERELVRCVAELPTAQAAARRFWMKKAVPLYQTLVRVVDGRAMG